MGRDKALLPLGRLTMVQEIAAQVSAAAGSVTLIGPPEKYLPLGIPVIPDAVENCGPIGGLYTALSQTQAQWNVLVACDMPNVTTAFLNHLFAAAETSGADCVVPENEAKLDPLCAVYHRRVAPLVHAAIHHKLFKMKDFIATLQAIRWPVPDARPLQNVNTPAEWSTR
jgi:molybdopterin-guanine dinucleotide biosynthesis protein A